MPRYWTIFFFFFGQSSRYVSNEQPCLKAAGLYEDLLFLSSLFHIFYFVFSEIEFHLLYVFQFLCLFFLDVLSQAYIKCSRKAFICIYIKNMYNTYIIKLMNFYQSKRFMMFWFHMFDLFIFLIKKKFLNKNKALLCSTGNYSQYFTITYNGK